MNHFLPGNALLASTNALGQDLCERSRGGLYKVTAACVPWLLQEDHIGCMPEPGLILGRESIPVVPYQEEDEVIES